MKKMWRVGTGQITRADVHTWGHTHTHTEVQIQIYKTSKEMEIKTEEGFNWSFINLIVKSKRKVKVKSLSCVQLFATPWTVAHQASPSMGFSRQEYWSGLPFASPGDLPPPRDWTQVSCIAGRRFTLCASREALLIW